MGAEVEMTEWVIEVAFTVAGSHGLSQLGESYITMIFRYLDVPEITHQVTTWTGLLEMKRKYPTPLR